MKLRQAFVLVGVATAVAPSIARADDPPPLPPPDAKPAERKQGDVVIEYVPGGEPAPGATPTAPAPNGQAPAAADTRTPAEREKVEADRFRLAFRGEGGYQYAQISGIPVNAGRLRLGLGTQNDSIANYATVSAMFGSTDAGLRTWDLRFGFTGDWLKASVFRFGLDGEMGYLVVHRTTLNDRMFAMGAGVGAHVGADLLPFGPRNDHAITVQARIDAHIHFGGAFVWGPTFMAGFRY